MKIKHHFLFSLSGFDLCPIPNLEQMMSIELSKRVLDLKPSASIAAKAKVRELESQGFRIIDFTIGEPDFATPPHIIDAAMDALKAGDTHYTATQGTDALRSAIVGKLKRDHNVSYDISEVIVGVGAKQLIFEAFAATLNKGDEVIVPAPYWVSYPDIVAVNDGTPVVVVCGEKHGFKLTPSALEAAITPKTKWLILNSPSNPTGAVYNQEELRALLAVLDRHPHVAIMTDDIYEHIVYDGVTHYTPVQINPDFKARCLLINGMSKAYAMTGWRVGYAAGPKPLIAAIGKLLGQSTTCASSISQAASAAALNGDQNPVKDMCAIYKQRRDRMCELLAEIPGIRCATPEGAFYVYPSVEGLLGKTTPDGRVLKTDLDVSMYFLEVANVAVMDGTSYGLSPYLRLSFATAIETIEQGCERIAQACAALS